MEQSLLDFGIFSAVLTSFCAATRCCSSLSEHSIKNTTRIQDYRYMEDFVVASRPSGTTSSGENHEQTPLSGNDFILQ